MDFKRIPLFIFLALPIGCASTFSSNKSSNASQLIDCSAIYIEGAAMGGAFGLVISTIADLKQLPLILLAAAVGYNVGDSTCDSLKKAAQTKQELIAAKNLIDKQKESIQLKNEILTKQFNKLSEDYIAKNNQLEQNFDALKTKVLAEIAALKKTERDANEVASMAKNRNIIHELNTLSKKAKESRIKMENMIGQLTKILV